MTGLMTRDDLLEEARIERVLVRYASALDERDWAALDEVFVAEASALYHGIGSYSGREAIVATVRQALAPCGRTQHLLGNVRITLAGAQASAKCYLQAIHAGQGAYQGQTLTVWGEYRDQLEKRPEGWRIVHRELEVFQVSGDIGGTALAAKTPAP